MHWNLGQLAVSLRLICEAPPLIEALERFPGLFQAAIVRRFLWRLNLQSQGAERDRELVEAAERAMVRGKIPINTFFHSYRGGRTPAVAEPDEDRRAFETVLADYRASGTLSHPYWLSETPCSMLIEEVEHIWSAIAHADDWAPLMQKVEAIASMRAALSE
jgi:uncharacterized protein YdiU (UPF0061 family)